jgi:hypothetical protein
LIRLRCSWAKAIRMAKIYGSSTSTCGRIRRSFFSQRRRHGELDLFPQKAFMDLSRSKEIFWRSTQAKEGALFSMAGCDLIATVRRRWTTRWSKRKGIRLGLRLESY